MKDAAIEETEKPTQKSATGITIYSLAGVGAIIDINSGKVLHIGVKNKYDKE